MSAWRRYEPSFDANLALPSAERLYFELSTAPTRAVVDALRAAFASEAPRAAVADELAEARELVAALDAMAPSEQDAARERLDELEDQADAKFNAAGAKVLADALGHHVRLGRNRHSIAGRPIETLGDYLEAVLQQVNKRLLRELLRTLVVGWEASAPPGRLLH